MRGLRTGRVQSITIPGNHDRRFSRVGVQKETGKKAENVCIRVYIFGAFSSSSKRAISPIEKYGEAEMRKSHSAHHRLLFFSRCSFSALDQRNISVDIAVDRFSDSVFSPLFFFLGELTIYVERRRGKEMWGSRKRGWKRQEKMEKSLASIDCFLFFCIVFREWQNRC